MSETEQPQTKAKAVGIYLNPDDLEFVKREAALYDIKTSEMIRHIIGVYRELPVAEEVIEARETLLNARKIAREFGLPLGSNLTSNP